MSYQIKSTPFFRRMVTTSKKNGQLQKLKDEYERIKDFNERTIDIKMRQVRLKRLFKEIEEIKETNLKKLRMVKEKMLKNQMPFYRDDLSKSEKNRRRSHQPRSSPEQSKAMTRICSEESFRLAKRSKLNSPPRKAQTDEDEEKSMARVIRRLTYGNRVSSWNMKRMLINSLNGEVDCGLRETLKETRRFLSKPFTRTDPGITSDIINTSKNEKLNHRINNGNSVSHNTIPKTSSHRKKYAAAMDNVEVASNKKLTGSNMSERSTIEDNLYEQSPDEARNLKGSEVIYPYLSSERQSEDDEKRIIARKRWGKISGVINSPFDINKCTRNLETLEKCHNDLEYQLRTISNDTHLPQSQIMVQDEQLNLSENDDDSLIEGEVLVNKEILFEDASPRSASATPKLGPTIPPPPPPPFLFNLYQSYRKMSFPPDNQTISNNNRIATLLKNYPQISYELPAVENQCGSAFRVQRLREIFEHKP
uniref:Uncharacterized protein n=1 Tax=Glossina austeni TaxID=7395 RepID=A0A1A9UHL3_GLOAU